MGKVKQQESSWINTQNTWQFPSKQGFRVWKSGNCNCCFDRFFSLFFADSTQPIPAWSADATDWTRNLSDTVRAISVALHAQKAFCLDNLCWETPRKLILQHLLSPHSGWLWTDCNSSTWLCNSKSSRHLALKKGCSANLWQLPELCFLSHPFHLWAAISSETNSASSWCNSLAGISVVSKLVFTGQPKLRRPWLNCDYSWASLNAKFSTPEKGCMLYNPGQKNPGF